MKVNLEKLRTQLQKVDPVRSFGRVKRVIGGMIEGKGLNLSIGDLCEIHSQSEDRFILAEAVGFRDDNIFLMPLGELRGISPGCLFEKSKGMAKVSVGPQLLGRVLNEFGQPIDNKGPLVCDERRPFYRFSSNPLKRIPIREPLLTGVRAIDGVLTCGKGQRLGIFAGSGVGKSVLMGMLARNTSADVNVIAMIGERGREIREFIENNLKEEGLKRSVIVAVPSDRPPMARIYAALAATSISEYFCEQGKDVMLMMDSSTRVAMALREVGLGMGEAPTSRGYTPSVFTFLPKLLERSGNFETGSITAFYTVLVEGDDMDEPVADTMRSILDGHIVLSRKIASQNHFPAIDILQSISRCMTDVTSIAHRKSANRLKELLAIYHDTEDLIKVGAYVKGNQSKVDEAISKIDRINSFLMQGIEEKMEFKNCLQQMADLSNEKI
ncbi:MAG: FliI/YscN family ATPase [Elusimicrobiota bacterium]